MQVPFSTGMRFRNNRTLNFLKFLYTILARRYRYVDDIFINTPAQLQETLKQVIFQYKHLD